jgi:hypothetical protein
MRNAASVALARGFEFAPVVLYVTLRPVLLYLIFLGPVAERFRGRTVIIVLLWHR